jgi:uncharacterized protein YbjQ (UPF0145 family)
MILTTTDAIEHHKIVEYCGIVTGVKMKMRDLVKGFANSEDYSKAMEKVMNELKEAAFQDIKVYAKALGANAVVGIQVDFEPIGTPYFGVSVSGTAVKVA